MRLKKFSGIHNYVWNFNLFQSRWPKFDPPVVRKSFSGVYIRKNCDFFQFPKRSIIKTASISFIRITNEKPPRDAVVVCIFMSKYHKIPKTQKKKSPKPTQFVKKKNNPFALPRAYKSPATLTETCSVSHARTQCHRCRGTLGTFFFSQLIRYENSIVKKINEKRNVDL